MMWALWSSKWWVIMFGFTREGRFREVFMYRILDLFLSISSHDLEGLMLLDLFRFQML